MQNILMTLGLMASIAIAIPTNDKYSIRSASDELTGPMAPMLFTGPVTVGGPDVELQGTAKEIYDQVLKLNPSYDPWDFPDFQASMAADGVTKAQWDEEHANGTLAVRSSANTLEARQSFDCNWGGWVRTWGDCIEGMDYLRRLGTAWCGAPAHACSRVSCSHNCGIFLCSQQNSEMRVHCKDIANDVGRIYTACGREVFGGAMNQLRGKMNFGSHATGVQSQSC